MRGWWATRWVGSCQGDPGVQPHGLHDQDGAEWNEGRHSQYMDKIEDSIDELKNIAQLIVGDRDAHATPVVRVDKNKLVEDYELTRLRMDAKIAELRLVAEKEMSEAPHTEHSNSSSELNDSLLNSFRNLCVSEHQRGEPGEG